MFLAKFKDGSTIEAGKYRRFVHVHDLQCGGEDCTARVTFRQGSSENGAIQTHGTGMERAQHFATLPGEKHVEGCQNKFLKTNPDPNAATSDYDWINFNRALATPEMKLLVNLNFDTGSGLNIKFRNASQLPYSNTEYGAFMRDNAPDKTGHNKGKPKYATISVHSLAELQDVIAKIEHANAKDRTSVCHALAIRDLEAILVGQDRSKMERIFHDLFYKNGVLGSLPDRTVGFPAIIQLSPTKATQSTVKQGPYFGNPRCVDQQGAKKLVLLSKLTAEDDAAREFIEDQGREVVVVACPVISEVDARLEVRNYYKGQQPDGHNGKFKAVEDGSWYLHMAWTAATTAQLAPVPEGQRLVKRKPPEKPAEPLPTARQLALEY